VLFQRMGHTVLMKRFQIVIVKIPSYKVPQSGTGMFNDNFMSEINMFSYKDAISIISDLLLEDLYITPKETSILSEHFDTNGKLMNMFVNKIYKWEEGHSSYTPNVKALPSLARSIQGIIS